MSAEEIHHYFRNYLPERRHVLQEASLTVFFFSCSREHSVCGLGEAAYAPAAQSMISGAFSIETRAMAASLCSPAECSSAAPRDKLRVDLSLRIMALALRALFIVALLGVLPALAVCATIQEPPRGPRSELVPIYAYCLSVPCVRGHAWQAGVTALHFSSVSLVTWGVDFVVQLQGEFQHTRSFCNPLAVIALVALLLGVFVRRLFLPIYCTNVFLYGRIIGNCGGVSLRGAVSDSRDSVWIVAIAGADGTFSPRDFLCPGITGPVTAVIHDMMPRRAHATSIGLYMFVTQINYRRTWSADCRQNFRPARSAIRLANFRGGDDSSADY